MFETDAQDGVTFHPASGVDAPAIAEVQAAVRRRLLRAVERRGLLSADDAQTMADWQHGGGFSVDAEVRIEAHEREGLERLMKPLRSKAVEQKTLSSPLRMLRYCARPAFALERLREIDAEHLVYESIKPGP